MVRKVLAAAGALLVGFHVWLFVNQLGDGALADVSLLARWGVAGLLVAALWYLRSRNLPMFWGRQAVAVWLLAALLHAPSVSDRLTTLDPVVPEEAAVVLTQVSTAASVFTLLLLAAVVIARLVNAGLRRYRLQPMPVRFAVRRSSTAPVSPRPPPAR